MCPYSTLADQRFLKALTSWRPQDIEDAARQIRQWLEDERAKTAFQHAALYVDRAWQACQTPEAFRFYQGMAAMLKVMAKMPTTMMAAAEKQGAVLFDRNRFMEQGAESVEKGLAFFPKNGKEQ